MKPVRPRKNLGQHFLRDPAVIQRIISAFRPQETDLVVEIGPGEGVLTTVLATHTSLLHVVELDERLVERLHQRFCGRSVNIHQANALDFDFSALASSSVKMRLIGNLPYNISTPLLFHLLKQIGCIRDMCFMLQKEVADRVLAEPGTSDYGKLSVMVQWRCEVGHVFDVEPEAFWPAPKVRSAVVQLWPRAAAPAEVDEECLQCVVSAVFNQRRKVLRNALGAYLTAEEIAAVDINPMDRGERLGLLEFARLARAYADKRVGR